METTYVSIHVVGVNGVAAHLGGKVDAVPNDVPDIVVTDVEPPLLWPIGERGAEVAILEPIRVRPVRLVGAGAEVANDFPALIMQLSDDTPRVFAVIRVGVQVDIVDGYVGLHAICHDTAL